MISVFDHPWLSGLFGDDAAGRLWTPEAQLGHFISFEAALAEGLETAGRVEPGTGVAAAHAIRAARIDLQSLRDGTAKDGLPVPDLVRQLRKAAPDVTDAIHTGATSQDVMDTALACTLRDTVDLLIGRVSDLVVILQEVDREFGARTLLGRTRMQAALPITVADRVGAWRAPLPGHILRLKELRPRIARLQLGGAVGTAQDFGADAGRIATHMAGALSLHVAPHVWHSDRSQIADFAAALSGLTGSLGKMGQDIALMAQQGIDEVRLEGGGGSSAMPHKSNPVLAELLVTLARFNATQVSGMHHALIHEQERSGAAWMLEWMLLPSMATTACRAVTVAKTLCDQIRSLGVPIRTSDDS